MDGGSAPSSFCRQSAERPIPCPALQTRISACTPLAPWHDSSQEWASIRCSPCPISCVFVFGPVMVFLRNVCEAEPAAAVRRVPTFVLAVLRHHSGRRCALLGLSGVRSSSILRALCNLKSMASYKCPILGHIATSSDPICCGSRGLMVWNSRETRRTLAGASP